MSTQQQYDAAIKELDDFNKKYSWVHAFKKRIALFHGIGAFLVYLIVFFCIYLINYWVTNNPSLSSEIGKILFLSFYPGIFFVVAFCGILEKPFDWVFYKRKNVDKNDVEYYDMRGRNIKTNISSIERRLINEMEVALIPKLNDLVYKTENRSIPYQRAKELLDELEKEDRVISKSGYTEHRGIYYNNRFNKISKNLILYDNPTIGSTPSKTYNKPIITTTKSVPAAPILKPLTSPILPVKEKTVDELFNELPKKVERVKPDTVKAAVKVDFIKLNEHRHSIGEMGELYALGWEKERLKQKGYYNLSISVVHVSGNDDSFGCDIISFNNDGTRKHIEVKTTTGSFYEPFYLSENEVLAMKKLGNYFIYRVYDFSVIDNKGNVAMIECPDQLEKHYSMKTISYKVSPK